MTSQPSLNLPPDRYFDVDPGQKKIAMELYSLVAKAPLVCPHGHVDPKMFADPDYSFGTPTDLLLIPDHYVFRMLYSQGIPLEKLGIPQRDGSAIEADHRKIWQIFGDNFYLFRGTPTGIWLAHELHDVFGINVKLTGETAREIYDAIAEKLESPEFRPRRLFERFNIEVLATTDSATDSLECHQAIRQSGWKGRIVPTFRPDAVVNIDRPDWRESIETLEQISGIPIADYRSYIRAIENRRAFFKSMGATATDHAALTPFTFQLSESEADAILQRALKGAATQGDAVAFTGHMMMESARMSIEDGLVMQFHPGSHRNHNQTLFDRFGADKGCDIPIPVEYTANLKPLLNRYGNDSAPHPDPVHPGRIDLFTRTGAAGGALPRGEAGAGLVVPRQSERHAPLPRLRHGNRWSLQHNRVQ